MVEAGVEDATELDAADGVVEVGGKDGDEEDGEAPGGSSLEAGDEKSDATEEFAYTGDVEGGATIGEEGWDDLEFGVACEVEGRGTDEENGEGDSGNVLLCLPCCDIEVLHVLVSF